MYIGLGSICRFIQEILLARSVVSSKVYIDSSVTYTPIYIYRDICMCVYKHICIYIQMYVYICIQVQAQLVDLSSRFYQQAPQFQQQYIQNILLYIPLYIRIYISAYVSINIYMYIYTSVCIYIYVYRFRLNLQIYPVDFTSRLLFIA